MKYVDLTQTFTSDMPVFPGDPKPTLEQIAHIKTDSFNDHKLTTAMHVGTHMDAPLHMIVGGKKIDELNIENFFGKGILIDVRGKSLIDTSVLAGITIPPNAAVLLLTGFGNKFREADYFEATPAVNEDFAKEMVRLGVKMVGMDTSGPDHDAAWPTHKILLKSDIVILENLRNLDQLIGAQDFEIIALPIKLQADAAPVRVIAKIYE